MPSPANAYRVLLVEPRGEHPLPALSFDGNQFTARGECGARYAGSFEMDAIGGLDVRMRATIPAGTQVAAGMITEEERTHDVHFYLTPRQLARGEPKPVLIPGLGRARLRVEPVGAPPMNTAR